WHLQREQVLLHESLALVIAHHRAVVPVPRVHPGAYIPPNGVLTSIVRKQCKANVPLVHVEQGSQIAKPNPKVRLTVEQLLARNALLVQTSGARHELGQPNRAHLADRVLIELTFQPNEPEGELRVDAFTK